MNTGTLPKTTTTLRIAQWMFYLNAAIWLGFGLFTFARQVAKPGQADPVVMLIIAVMMLGNSAAMIASGAGVAQRKKIMFYFALVILAANILLTFTDQFGLFDFLTLLLDLVLLGLLIVRRRDFSVM